METDKINPGYYTKGLELIDILSKKLPREEFIGFIRGNVFKYVFRYEDKNGVEDLKKAQWYLDKLIETEEALSISN